MPTTSWLPWDSARLDRRRPGLAGIVVVFGADGEGVLRPLAGLEVEGVEDVGAGGGELGGADAVVILAVVGHLGLVAIDGGREVDEIVGRAVEGVMRALGVLADAMVGGVFPIGVVHVGREDVLVVGEQDAGELEAMAFGGIDAELHQPVMRVDRGVLDRLAVAVVVVAAGPPGVVAEEIHEAVRRRQAKVWLTIGSVLLSDSRPWCGSHICRRPRDSRPRPWW